MKILDQKRTRISTTAPSVDANLTTHTPTLRTRAAPAYPDSLMPWSESVPTGTRLKPEAAKETVRMADDSIIDIDPSAFRDDEE